MEDLDEELNSRKKIFLPSPLNFTTLPAKKRNTNIKADPFLAPIMSLFPFPNQTMSDFVSFHLVRTHIRRSSSSPYSEFQGGYSSELEEVEQKRKQEQQQKEENSSAVGEQVFKV